MAGIVPENGICVRPSASGVGAVGGDTGVIAPDRFMGVEGGYAAKLTLDLVF